MWAHGPFSPPCTPEPQQLVAALQKGSLESSQQLSAPKGAFPWLLERRLSLHACCTRGEECHSCPVQGWDAPSKGGVAAVKNPALVGGGCSPSSHSLCGIVGALQLIPGQQCALSSAPCRRAQQCLCLTGGAAWEAEAGCVQALPQLRSNLWTGCSGVIRAPMVTRRAWGGRRQPYMILISVIHSP